MTMTAADSNWDPEQYRRFANERAQPFHDLLAMIGDRPIGRAVDLGCGPGELTALAAQQLEVGQMVGIDNAPTMLASASRTRKRSRAIRTRRHRNVDVARRP